MNKKEIEDEIQKIKDANGGQMNKAQLMNLLARSDMTPEERAKFAKKHGIKLTKKD